MILLTAFGNVSNAVDAMRHGAFDFLQKPLKSPGEIRQVVRAAAEVRAQAEEPPAPMTKSQEARRPLTWGAPAMRTVVRALERVAKLRTNVLFLGESGVGKELFARRLHGLSRRADGPFVAVNAPS